MELEIDGLELGELPVVKQGERRRAEGALFPAEVMALLERNPEFRLLLLGRLESWKDAG